MSYHQRVEVYRLPQISRRNLIFGGSAFLQAAIGGLIPGVLLGGNAHSTLDSSSSSADDASPKRQAPRPWLRYTGPEEIEDSDFKFRRMLAYMSTDERIQLAQSLQLFPRIQLQDFGSFGLKPYRQYSESERPKTFNDVPPDVIEKAFQENRLNHDVIQADKIVNQLLWVSSSLWTYPFKYSINYHSIVDWLAGEYDARKDISPDTSTFYLERKLIETSFERIWDKLTPEQRLELLAKIEQSTNSKIANKAAIAAMTGSAALAALATTVAFSGFAFYTTMSVVICTVAGFFGITLPFAVYTTASSTVAALAGPLGWILAGVLAAVGVVLMARANPRKTASFVFALHFIKAQAFHEAGLIS